MATLLRRSRLAVPLLLALPLAALAETPDSLPRDPALTVGTLPNGLRYYIRVNQTPAKRAFLQLAVNAGSIQEDDDQRGLAHFLEHMAFNGTKHFPRHELISTLQLVGMRFGADVNAYTSFDETVYMLEVPTDEPKFLQHGLTMLEDWASGGILLDSLEVVAERGVVISEWRTRLLDTTTQAAQAHRDSVLYGADSRYRTRPPIGSVELLQAADAAPLRRFYRDWYRPDLMAVVVVGDVDPVQIKREIRARFGKIPAARDRRLRVSPRLPSHAEPRMDVYRGTVQPQITVLWKQPRRLPATPAAYRKHLVEELLFTGLQSRLLELARRPQRPFLTASVGRTELPARGSEAYELRVIGWPTDSLEGGLAAVLTELERVARHGVPAPTLERAKAALLRQLQGAAAGQNAVTSLRYAQSYVAHYLQGGGPLLTPRQELALARELVRTIVPEDLARTARFWRSGADRLTLVTFPKYAHERSPTAEGIGAIFDSVARLQLPADSARLVAEAPLLERRPAPGRIVRERRHAAAGVTEWTLANGARVLFKPTSGNPDELFIRAVSPGGLSLLPDTLFFTPGRMVAEMMTQAAGLGAHDRAALEGQLAGTGLRQFAVELTPTQEGLRLGGSPRDLELLFQLLYLQFTAPKLDTAALGVWQRTGRGGDFSFDDQINALIAGSNPRLAPPPRSLMALADTATALAIYRDRFGNAGDFTFIVVGAATAREVRPLVEHYIASLPSTRTRETAGNLDVHAWNRQMRRTDRQFDVPRASTLLLFDGEFPSTPEEYLRERRRLDALAWALRLRFTDALREQMGGTYGTNVLSRTYALPQEHYRFTIQFDAAPERLDGMLDTTLAILDSVRAHGATADELARIAALQRREWETALQENGYWLDRLELFDRLQIPFARLMTPPAPPTAAEVRQAAVTYLPSNAYIHLVSLPRDSMLWVKPDSASRGTAQLARWPH